MYNLVIINNYTCKQCEVWFDSMQFCQSQELGRPEALPFEIYQPIVKRCGQPIMMNSNF